MSKCNTKEYQTKPDGMDICGMPLHWRHNGRDGVSNHQPHDCLLNRLYRRRSKIKSKLHVTSLCVGNSPVTVEFPTQRASNAENVSIWWRHHTLYAGWPIRSPCAKHNSHPLFTWNVEISIWIDLTDMCVLESVSSRVLVLYRHISVRLYLCKTTRLSWTCKLTRKWIQLPTSPLCSTVATSTLGGIQLARWRHSNGNIFRVTGPLWGESTGHRWIPLTKASDAGLWCFLWSAPKQTLEQTTKTPIIWDPIALIMTSL